MLPELNTRAVVFRSLPKMACFACHCLKESPRERCRPSSSSATPKFILNISSTYLQHASLVILALVPCVFFSRSGLSWVLRGHNLSHFKPNSNLHLKQLCSCLQFNSRASTDGPRSQRMRVILEEVAILFPFLSLSLSSLY